MYNVPPAPKKRSERDYRLVLALALPFLLLGRYFFAFWMLVFMNRKLLPAPVAFFGFIPAAIFAALTAYAVLWLTLRLYRRLPGANGRGLDVARTMAILAIIVSVAVWIGWILNPYVCGSSGSFGSSPTKRCDCRGLTVTFEPVGADATAREYCIGQEIS